MLRMGRFAIAHAVIGVSRLHGRPPHRPARARDGGDAHRRPRAALAEPDARSGGATESVEHRYRTLVEELPAALYISSLDKTSNALYVSPAIVDLLGYSLDEWARKPQLFDEILHPLDRERRARRDRRREARGRAVRGRVPRLPRTTARSSGCATAPSRFATRAAGRCTGRASSSTSRSASMRRCATARSPSSCR